MTKLTNAQFLALKWFRLAGENGTSVNGHTERALRKRGLIERVPGRLVSRITPAGRTALEEHNDRD